MFMVVVVLVVVVGIVITTPPTAAERNYSKGSYPEDFVSPNEVAAAALVEQEMFGKSANDMDENDLASFFPPFGGHRMLQGRNLSSSSTYTAPKYRLVNVPLAYHILVNQKVPNDIRRVVTDKQINWATNITNQLFKIYNRKKKRSIQFVSFVTDGPYRNTDITDSIDCYDIKNDDFYRIVKQAPDWQYKIHIITCGTTVYGSFGFLPLDNYAVNDIRRQLYIIDDYQFTCFDDDANVLCDGVSNIRTTRSARVAYAHGKLFGLYDTSNNGCKKVGDGVSDTPATNGDFNDIGCPGLLPYDKNRNLFRWYRPNSVNTYKSPKECYLHNQACPSTKTCAACEYSGRLSCCTSDIPPDTCPKQPGIDPQTNVMSLTPDICAQEFTPGQMIKMMAQIRQKQMILFCNYANVIDKTSCGAIDCGPTATSPNCKN